MVDKQINGVEDPTVTKTDYNLSPNKQHRTDSTTVQHIFKT